MRTKGSFEYGSEFEELILKGMEKDIPYTTNFITKALQSKESLSIHHSTVTRLLENMREKGLVKKKKLGRMSLWSV